MIIVVKIRSLTSSIYFCRIKRATGRLTLAPECVRVATTPDATPTILVCGIRTATNDVDGKRRGSRGNEGQEIGEKIS